ncbi:MAG: DUF1761 domain-containing protein [Bacteroidota bacterium]|nr:DUF1761 domain-containing protein [Bacteroidota bacterium]
MNQVKVNYLAVAVASIAMWVLGMVWYTALGSQWMAYNSLTTDMTKSFSGGAMAAAYGGAFISYFIAFYCFTYVMHAFQVNDIKGGLQAAFWSWLGFTVTALYVSNAFAMRSFGLTLIDGGYWLVGFLIGSVILVKMKKKETPAQ